MSEQPLVSLIPNSETQLPIELNEQHENDFENSGPGISVHLSSLSLVRVGPLGRSAQAAWLVERIMKSIATLNEDSGLTQVKNLDSTIQSFLGTLMIQSEGSRGVFCEPIAIALR